MGALDDLIKHVDEPALRTRLQEEFDRFRREKKFGLVFESHLPELTPLSSAKIAPGSLVARRKGPANVLARVERVDGKQASCLLIATGERETRLIGELMVVKQLGDPVFPCLVPIDRVDKGPPDAPWHALIEADNYHALELLRYLHAGEVDCIYIDPPYNTGARDWKYNNDYVDANDGWRHSKWLAMMKRRLVIAKELLNPATGVMIVTIDEHEVHHLGMLLEELFPTAHRQMATIVINQKGVAQGRLSRAEEFAFFVFMPRAFLPPASDDLLSPERGGKRFTVPRWEWLLRGGTNSRRADRPKLFFPIYVDPSNRKVVRIGEPLPLDDKPNKKTLDGTVAWPIRTDGSYGNWRVSPPTLRELNEKGFVKLGGFDKERRTWTVLYLGEKARHQIVEGKIRIAARDAVSGSVEVEYTESQQRNVKTVWHRSTHDSGNHGSALLRNILGEGGRFAFPKSVYAERDAIGSVVRANPRALVVDFFAGSGTTLHAVNLLNKADGGKRRCILVTNNEVSSEEAERLSQAGFAPGDHEWEKNGVCQAVTWPRAKFTIRGERDDGSKLEGEYFSGLMGSVERPRRFKQLGFVDPAELDNLATKRQILGLIGGLSATDVISDTAYVLSDDQPQTILFDVSKADEWLSKLKGHDHIQDFYIVTREKKTFDALKRRIEEEIGSTALDEEVRWPARDGFQENLEYFRLDFLQKDDVILKRRFKEVLPLLWMRSGAVGPRPEDPEELRGLTMLIPKENNFGVLLQEASFARFEKEVSGRPDLTHAFLVTDSEDAYHDMASRLRVPFVIQLYRDYLENFMVNKGGIS